MKTALRFITIVISVFYIIEGALFLFLAFPIYVDMVWQVLYFFNFSVDWLDVLKLIGITLFPFMSICAFALLVTRLFIRRPIRYHVALFFLSSAIFFISFILPSQYNLNLNILRFSQPHQDIENSEPKDDREFIISVYEDYEKSNPEIPISVRVETTETYSDCSIAGLSGNMQKFGNTIVIDVGNVVFQEHGCYFELIPATYRTQISDEDGLYALVIRKSGREDRYAFRITGGEINSSEISTSYTRLNYNNKRVFRRPVVSITADCRKYLDKQNANLEPSCNVFFEALRGIGARKSKEKSTSMANFTISADNYSQEIRHFDYVFDLADLKEEVELYWMNESLQILISTREGEYIADNYSMREEWWKKYRASEAWAEANCKPHNLIIIDNIPREWLERLSEYLKSHNLVPTDSSLGTIFKMGNEVNTYAVTIKVEKGKAEFWASEMRENFSALKSSIKTASSCD